ncbi:MAG TPA: hypothetical protein VFF26_13170 [Gallionella sp.]|nr:hypothetical protein [Gallionella sp.]
MLYKVAFWITCLLLVSTGAMAAPRALVRDGSQIGFISKEMGMPASSAYLGVDAAEPQQITAPSRLGFGSPSTDSDETDVTGAGRFEVIGKLRNRSRDILVSPSSQDHAATIGGFTSRGAGFGIASGLREDANLVAQHIPANIRLILAQPAAPPAIRKQCPAPRLA